jgi:hypothetical protein
MGQEVAVNCLCSARSCAACWCPDSELADGNRGECQYRRMADVMAQLDAARDELLDEDDMLVGRVKDVKDVERHLLHRLLPCRQTTSFNDFSIEAGILLRGNGEYGATLGD